LAVFHARDHIKADPQQKIGFGKLAFPKWKRSVTVLAMQRGAALP
jgi:hypothetical protein